MLIGGTTSEPTGKLSDFGYCRIHELSVGDMTQNEQSSGSSYACLTAPERLLVTDGGGESFKSDVYSLGMSIIEAKTGDLPWGEELNYHDIVNRLVSEESYRQPAHVFLNKEWDLVQAMIRIDPNDRMSWQMCS